MLAESELPAKYWADAVQTMVYVQNLLPNFRQPKTIPAELWTGQHQDILHLCPFGCTSYAYVPLDLNLSKLNPRSVKTALLGYFGYNRYKLLDKSTGAVFKSRDIIFEEEITHLAKQPTATIFSDDNDPLAYRSLYDCSEVRPGNDPKPEPTSLLIQGIAPRPLAIFDLHKNDKNEHIIPHTDSNIPIMAKDSNEETSENPSNLSLALRRTCRTIRPTTQLQELIEYTNRPIVNNIEDNN